MARESKLCLGKVFLPGEGTLCPGRVTCAWRATYLCLRRATCVQRGQHAPRDGHLCLGRAI